MVFAQTVAPDTLSFTVRHVVDVPEFCNMPVTITLPAESTARPAGSSALCRVPSKRRDQRSLPPALYLRTTQSAAVPRPSDDPATTTLPDLSAHSPISRSLPSAGPS